MLEGSKDPVTPFASICSLSYKGKYSNLLNLEDLPPPTFEKTPLASGVEKSDLNKIYLLPFKATIEIKLTMFQYKIIHRILQTNSLLHKTKNVDSTSCPFCRSECQTLWHLLKTARTQVLLDSRSGTQSLVIRNCCCQNCRLCSELFALTPV